jgi:uncharacterized RDD family membrane protein YckC
MATNSLIVTSATGVNVELAIAGPGSRSYAFIIDWHIRLLGALCWVAFASLFLIRVMQWPKQSPAVVGAIVSLPAALLYFLYHPLIELLMRGRTPGKRMAGVRIVNRQGGTPSTLAVLVRNAFRLIDSLPVFYGVGLCMTIFSAQRVRLGDLAAGTLLVHDGETEASALRQLGSLSLNPQLDPNLLALGNELLLRWNELESERRRQLAGDLLKRIAASLGTTPPPIDKATRYDQYDEVLRGQLRHALTGKAP